jgi:hypothetical protein
MRKHINQFQIVICKTTIINYFQGVTSKITLVNFSKGNLKGQLPSSQGWTRVVM